MRSVYAKFVFKILATLSCLPAFSGGWVLGQGSMNVVLRGNWDNNSLPTVAGYQYNDVWGYAAGGREYGIIGSTVGVHVIDITTPTAPVQVAQLNSGCASTRWRDFATYQNYLYVISDNCAGSTLQIFNLSPLPGVPTLVYNSNAFFSTAHTLFINPVSRRIYISGANTQPSGIIILDITNPIAPTQAASFTLGAYTHDVYVHNDTLYAFFGTSGMGSFDLVNLAYPYALGYIFGYPESGYAHSGWGINNNKHMIWMDETADRGIHVGDVTDPYNITFRLNFRSALLGPAFTNSMAHNVVAVGDLIYVSYYQDGLQIWNVNDPLSPVRVGYYDTNINATYTGMFGAWGVHPPLPSGNILISDTENGLFVLQFNNVFPANMVDFTADALASKVHLRWTTESETGCEKFVVERSTDGKRFEDIGEKGAAGNSTTRVDYEAFDDHPHIGRNFYRLRQMDFDGNHSYSNVREVNFDPSGLGISVFPNPASANENVMLQFRALEAAHADLDVYDMVGRRIMHQGLELIPGTVEMELPDMDWAAGSYLLRLSAKGRQVEQKILIAR
jgi:choice-of-anchor B domain-containing protein